MKTILVCHFWCQRHPHLRIRSTQVVRQCTRSAMLISDFFSPSIALPQSALVLHLFAAILTMLSLVWPHFHFLLNELRNVLEVHTQEKNFFGSTLSVSAALQIHLNVALPRNGVLKIQCLIREKEVQHFYTPTLTRWVVLFKWALPGNMSKRKISPKAHKKFWSPPLLTSEKRLPQPPKNDSSHSITALT